MNNTISAPSAKRNPLVWIVGAVVTGLAVVGVAALTGLLPSHPVAQEAVVAGNTLPVPAVVPAVVPAPVSQPTAASQAEAAPAPKVSAASTHKHPTKKVEPKPAQAVAVSTPAEMQGEHAVQPAPSATPVCYDCGVVSDIRQRVREGEGSGLGALAGGVLGGAVANNIGRGNGRTLATIAGAVGGGILGNKIEKSQRQTVSYQIVVRMEDGTDQVLDVPEEPSWRIGDRVKLVNGRLVSRQTNDGGHPVR